MLADYSALAICNGDLLRTADAGVVVAVGDSLKSPLIESVQAHVWCDAANPDNTVVVARHAVFSAEFQAWSSRWLEISFETAVVQRDSWEVVFS